MTETRQMQLDGGAVVTATVYRAETTAPATVVLAHGAGANQASPFMTATARGLADRGLDVVTFNFPYTERGRKIPDPQPVLEACYRAVLAHVAADPGLGARPLVIGGKSLGGRMATHVAAARDAGEPGGVPWWDSLRGLVLLGYPLHPPAKPQQIRVSHLPNLRHPLLIVQGERDAFGTPAELHLFFDVLEARAEIHAVAQGNHSLEVPKRSGIAQAEVDAAVRDRIAAWVIERAAPGTGARRRQPA